MLVFHTHCQLGNQMFIFACAHSLSKLKKQKYCLSNIKDLKYFVLTENEKINNFIKYLWFRISSKILKYNFHHLQDNRIDYCLELSNETNKRNWYYGYFQGEKYFFNNELEIRKRFEIKNQYKVKFDNLKKEIIGEDKYAIVHIRLKDFKTFGPDFLGGPDLSLPFSYYHKLIKEIPNNYKIIFLSDEIEKVKIEFNYVENAYYSENTVIDDLQFIIKADICILSCSTFSWWGAWLNEKKTKTIFVPKYFLGFKVKKEFPVKMIPKDWTQIEVYV